MKTRILLFSAAWLIGGVALWMVLALVTRQAPRAELGGGDPAAPADLAAAPRAAATPAWQILGGPPGGLGYDIRYDFSDPETWYVTDNFAGVHKSIDHGRTWLASNSGIPKQAGPSGDWRPIFSLTVDPHNPAIVWAGTDRTGHLYRSTDSGLTWEERDNGITIEHSALSFRGITVDPVFEDTVYAMGETLDASLGGGTIWGTGDGGVVYKSTDAGENWVKIWDGGMPSALARYLWINPRNPGDPDDDILFVSTGIFDRGGVGFGDPETDPDPFGGLGILRSFDSGQTWELLGEANGLEMLLFGSLYMHPLDPMVLLAAAGHEMGPVQIAYLQSIGHSPAGIYRTEDGGDTWVHVLEPPVERVNEEFSAVEMCLTDPNVAYAGSAKAVYRSLDGGMTWELRAGGTTLTWGPPGVRAGWPIDLQCDPLDTDVLFANNYQGGNFVSHDGGATWENASDGYSGAQMRTVAVDPREPAWVYAQGRSGMWRTEDGGTSWYGLRYPSADCPCTINEGVTLALDPANPDHVLAGDVDCVDLLVSENGGLEWHVHDLPEGRAAPISAMAFAPSDPSYVYLGVGEPLCRDMNMFCTVYPSGAGVIVSSDGGESWQWSEDTSLETWSVTDLAVHPLDPMVVYAAATIGGLFRTSDGGGTWTALPIEDLPLDSEVRSVAIDPANPEHLLVGTRLAGVYSSSDGGLTWDWSGSGMEPNSVPQDLLFVPEEPSVVFLADQLSGVFRSDDGGATWLALTDGMESRSVVNLSLSTDGQHLYAATNGHGVYRLDLNGEPPLQPRRHVFLPLALRER